MILNSHQALRRAWIAILVFSSAPAGIRAVDLDAYALGILRLVLASAGMTILLLTQQNPSIPRPSRWTSRTWKALLLIGLTFGVHWLLFFLSIKIASAAVGAIGFSTYGLHLIVLGWLLGMGRLTGIDLVGLLLAVMGTLLLVPEFSFQNLHTRGLIAGIFSGLAAAVLPLLHQRYADVDGNLRTWGQFTFALPVFFCFLPQAQWHAQPSDILLILYLGLVVTLVGHGLWVQAITALPTTTTSILSYLYLPGALVFSYFALGEKLSGRMLVGTLCVLAANGLALWNRAKWRSMEASVPETT